MDGPVDNSIVKAVTVLSSLRVLDAGGSARELAALTSLPRSTTQRLLSTLTSTGMVIQDPSTQKYKIGPRALLIGLGYNSGLSLVTEARPHMLLLRDTIGETVGLSIAVGATRIFLEEVQCTAELRFASEMGKSYPLWAGANGRVLMSALLPEQVDELLRNRSLDDTVEHPLAVEEIRAQLVEFMQTGYSMAFNEAIANVNSLAIPVRDATGSVVAALSVSGPAQRFTVDRMNGAIEPLSAACASISDRLGNSRAAMPFSSFPSNN